MTLAAAAAYAKFVYPLDEASGNAVAAVGGTNLTQGGSVGAGTLFGLGARDFESGSSHSFSAADAAVFDLLDTDWMVSCWVQLESKGADRVLVAKWEFSANKSYSVRYSAADDRFQLDVRDGSGVQGFVNASNFGSPATATPYLIHAWHSATDNQLGIAVNAGTANTNTHATGVNNSTAAFYLGHEEGGNAGYHDGLLSQVVALDGYILDATERTEHYNGGSPVPFASWAGGGGGTVRPRSLLTVGCGA